MFIKKQNKGAICAYRSYWTREEVLEANRGRIISTTTKELICLVNDRPVTALCCTLTGQLWLDIAWNLVFRGLEYDEVISILEFLVPELTITDILSKHVDKLAKLYELVRATDENVNVGYMITLSVIRMAARFGYNPDSIEFRDVFKDAIEAMMSILGLNDNMIPYEIVWEWYNNESMVLKEMLILTEQRIKDK